MVKYAAIEGGGTTWVVAIAENAPDNIVEREQFDTDPNPIVTLSKIRKWLSTREFVAAGIGSFGPIDGKLTSPYFGFITSTPKPGWKMTDVVGLLGFRDEYSHIPFKFDTDVNAPAVAEFRLHRKPGTSSGAYITVGTGIGVGLVINGKTVHGLVHPEAGHLQTAKFSGDDFVGTCPFHGSCVEGMCSTGALASRKQCLACELPNLSDDDSIWDACAYYIAQLCVTLILVASPERIVIGGGVLNRSSLYPKIRIKVLELLNNYIQDEMLTSEKIDEYIVQSFWGSNAGLVGALYLAEIAFEEANETK